MRAMRLVVVAFFLVAVGCDPSPEQAVRDVCTAFCQCRTVLPSQLDRCVSGCTQQVPAVSDECLTCTYTYSQSCPELFGDCYATCGFSTDATGFALLEE